MIKETKDDWVKQDSTFVEMRSFKCGAL